MRKLQPLGGVHGREPHRILIVVATVELGEDRHRLRQPRQRRAIVLRPLLHPVDEVAHVLPAGGSGLVIERIEQPGAITDRLDQIVEHLCRRLMRGTMRDAVHERAERAQGFELARGKLGLDAGLEHRRKHRLVALPGIAAQRLEGGVADAALGGGDRADEGGVVFVVGHQPQVRHDVADLGALEERLPARQHVRNLLPAQRLLDHARLVVAPVQHGVVGEPAATLELVRLQPHHHGLGLELVGITGHDRDRITHAVL